MKFPYHTHVSSIIIFELTLFFMIIQVENQKEINLYVFYCMNEEMNPKQQSIDIAEERWKKGNRRIKEAS